ncbi:Protoheme IX farnesyltransferase 1 [Maioricimonas rarisocia]|uniref:Protoheme IX farnesyltransferase n=1 Tax=Maioricimonas rarisocia TaxID=2528026 RepID=A0A517Z1T9_9PLAN|nr:heme o synthase [Maioricimonas rarisocia]QDU36444.1 Protoheme IX farnesyltransferase 1 [Maioricimonas rarisocia]
MSTASTTSTVQSVDTATRPVAWPVDRPRLSAYIELAKPRISVMVLITVSVGYAVGARGQWDLVPLLHALLGIGLVATASGCLNQLIERRTDARMLRTADRPLPSGRLTPSEVLLFATFCGVFGTLWLVTFVNLLTALLTAATLLMYVFAYTPLKRHTSLCTAIGAIPGALPPVLGWTAAGGSLDTGAFALFAILFLWQFPHFLAIAWLYREQYGMAGLKMLPARSEKTPIVGLLAAGYALALIPVSFLPRVIGLAGDSYLFMAVLLGAVYAAAAIRFLRDRSVRTARGVLWASLVYLPSLWLTLTLDHVRMLQ